MLEQYVKDVRDAIGYEIPLAIDHFGHICVEDCIILCRRLSNVCCKFSKTLTSVPCICLWLMLILACSS